VVILSIVDALEWDVQSVCSRRILSEPRTQRSGVSAAVGQFAYSTALRVRLGIHYV